MVKPRKCTQCDKLFNETDDIYEVEVNEKTFHLCTKCNSDYLTAREEHQKKKNLKNHKNNTEEEEFEFNMPVGKALLISFLIIVGLFILLGILGSCSTNKGTQNSNSYSSIISTPSLPIKQESNVVSTPSLTDKECIEKSTAIMIMINVQITRADDVIYDFTFERVTLSQYRSRLTLISNEFSEIPSFIKSENLDVGCSAELRGNVISPLTTISNLYSIGYQKGATFTSESDLLAVQKIIGQADDLKEEIEDYILSH